MAHIFDFNAHASKSCQRAARASMAGSAEIVIFPGVRYERAEAGSVSTPARRHAKQRDRIELPE